MSFIHRDFLGPLIAGHNNKIVLKKRFEKTTPKITIGGVQVFGNSTIWYHHGGMRSDKDFKQYLRTLGTDHKELSEQINRTEGLNHVEHIYFKLNQGKLLRKIQTEAVTVNKLNMRYLSRHVNNVNTATTFYYEQGRAANEVVAKVPRPNKEDNFYFVVSGGVSNTSPDGLFTISELGDIHITAAGVTPTKVDEYGNIDVLNGRFKHPDANKVNNESPLKSLFFYTVRSKREDGTVYNRAITIGPKRSYIDVRVVIGGTGLGMPAQFTTMTDGVPDMYSDLPALRAAVEGDPVRNIAGVYTGPIHTSPVVKLKGVDLKVADVSYDEEWGSEYDVLALLDNGTSFEVVNNVLSESLTIEELNGAARGLSAGLMNIKYTYTKRYRIKASTSAGSVLATRVKSIGDRLLTPPSPSNNFNDVVTALTNLTVNSTIKKIIESIYMDSSYVDDGVFHRGYLRVDAFNNMGPIAFAELLLQTLDTDHKKKPRNIWETVGTILIIIAAAAVTIFTKGTAAKWTAAVIAAQLAKGMIVLIVAAKIGQAAGMHPDNLKMIGQAIHVYGIALSVATITAGAVGVYDGIDAFMRVGGMNAAQIAAVGGQVAVDKILTSIAIDIAISSAGLAVGVASFGVNTLGWGGEKERELVNMAAAVFGLYSSWGSFTAGMGAPSVGPVKNIANAVKLAESGMRGYTAIQEMGMSTPPITADEQAEPEEGVEKVFLVERRAVTFDAIEALNDQMNLQYGVNVTNSVVSKQSL